MSWYRLPSLTFYRTTANGFHKRISPVLLVYTHTHSLSLSVTHYTRVQFKPAAVPSAKIPLAQLNTTQTPTTNALSCISAPLSVTLSFHLCSCFSLSLSELADNGRGLNKLNATKLQSLFAGLCHGCCIKSRSSSLAPKSQPSLKLTTCQNTVSLHPITIKTDSVVRLGELEGAVRSSLRAVEYVEYADNNTPDSNQSRDCK